MSYNQDLVSEECNLEFIANLKRAKFHGILDINDPSYKSDLDKEYIPKIEWDGENLRELEKKIRMIDKNFNLPEVMRAYRELCSVKYEGISLAKNYNNLTQILMSGRGKELNSKQKNILYKYTNEIRS